MPLVIVETGNVPVGRTFDAILCDANIAGLPDHRTAVPVQATLIREGRTLKVEPDDACAQLTAVWAASSLSSHTRRSMRALRTAGSSAMLVAPRMASEDRG
jgi:hypothetical protein